MDDDVGGIDCDEGLWRRIVRRIVRRGGRVM